MPAVRNIPYGIQQPAVSAQVAQLEEFLGVTLFQRRPFALTPAGEKLYEFIAPVFFQPRPGGGGISGRAGAAFPHRRLDDCAARPSAAIIAGRRKKFPGLKVSLRDGYPVQLEALLQRDEVDLVITLIERKPPAGFHSLVLLELPLVLLVEKNSRVKSAEELWARDKIDEPLICLPAGETLAKNFQAQLTRLGVEWFPDHRSQLDGLD